MNKYTYLNHETWLEDRINYIGASEIATLCKQNKWQTNYELWLEKTKTEKKEISESLQKLLDTGNELEPITLSRFFKNRGKLLEASKVLDYHYKKKHFNKKSAIQLFTEFKKDKMIAHPDMLYWDDCEWINIEAKYVKYKGDDWNFNYDDAYGKPEDIPFNYYLQVQYQMLLSDIEKTILCVNYLGSEHYEYYIEIEPEITAMFEPLVNKFWYNLVETGCPPMPENHKDNIKLFPDKNNKSMTLPDDLELDTILLKDRYKFISDKIKKLNKEKESIKSNVMTLLAENNILTTSNGEQIAKISNYDSERIIALSKIKKENKKVYNYLKKNNCINISDTSKLYF